MELILSLTAVEEGVQKQRSEIVMNREIRHKEHPGPSIFYDTEELYYFKLPGDDYRYEKIDLYQQRPGKRHCGLQHIGGF